MKKRFWALFLAVMMIMSILPTSAFAASEEVDKNLQPDPLYYSFEGKEVGKDSADITLSKTAKHIGGGKYEVTLSANANQIVMPKATEVVFVLDASGSMRTCTEAHSHNPNGNTITNCQKTYNGYTGFQDPHSRWSIATSAIETMKGNLGEEGISYKYVAFGSWGEAAEYKSYDAVTLKNNSRTYLEEGVEKGISVFSKGDTNKVLIVVSDGEATDGYKPDGLQDFKDAEGLVYTVGFTFSNSNFKGMATSSKHYFEAADAKDLAFAMGEIAENIVGLITDPMGTDVELVGDADDVIVTGDDTKPGAIVTGSTINWTDNKGLNGEVVLTYEVEIEPTESTMQHAGPLVIALNGDAKLNYSYTQNGQTHEQSVKFPIPKAVIDAATLDVIYELNGEEIDSLAEHEWINLTGGDYFSIHHDIPDVGKKIDNYWVAGIEFVDFDAEDLDQPDAKAYKIIVTLTAEEPVTEADYTVKHWFEKLNPADSEDKYEQNLTDYPDETASGDIGAKTNAAAAKVDGFTAQAFEQEEIAAGNSTVVDIYYDRNSYNVTYAYKSEVPGQSTLPPTESYKYGELVTVADVATAPGYTFSGWDKDDFTMPAEPVTITGSWTADAASVTWIVDGKAVDTQTGNTGDNVEYPDYEAPTGYTLDGWYTDAECTEEADIAETMLGHITYYGKTVPKTDTAYKVEHYKQNLEGTGYDLAETENKTGTTDTTATATAKTYPGFTFDATIEGTVQSGTIAGDGSLVLKLYYTRNVYTVTFMDEDGTVLKAATEYAYGTPAADIIQPETPTKADDAQYSYQFAGWSPAVADVTENVEYWATYEPAGDEKQYTFTFDANGGKWESAVSGYEMTGTTKASKVYTYLDVVEEIEEPTRASDDEYDYVFLGWYLTSEGDGKVWFVTYEGKPVQPLIIEDTTVYAKWQGVPKVQEPTPVEKSGNLYINLQDENNSWLGGTDKPIKVTTDYLIAAETGDNVDYVIPAAITVGENKYIYEAVVSGELSDVVDYDGENFVVVLQYTLDNLNDKDDKPTGGDGIPDKYQAVVTYQVVNGTWDGTKVDPIEKIFTLKEKDPQGVWTDIAVVLADTIPTGMKADAAYLQSSGEWDTDITAETPVTGCATYIYEFKTTKAPSISITKVADKTSVRVGDKVTYTITATNTGNSDLTNVRITDEFLDGGKGNKTTDGVWSIDTLKPGESIVAKLVYTTVSDDLSGLMNSAVVDTNETTENETTEEVEVKRDPITPVGPSKPALNYEDHINYIIGYEDGTVRPLNTITRAEVATIFFRLLDDESRENFWSKENPFPDVTIDMWCNNAISTMFNAGIITGYPDGTFGPYDPVSRAEFATIAARFSEVKDTDGETNFLDLSKSYWAYSYIELAEELGWVQGYQGYFRPEDDMTRAEVMTTVNRVLKRAVEEDGMLEDMIEWPDNLPTDWFYEDVQEATNSHTYYRTKKLVKEVGTYQPTYYYEKWSELIENPDWAALERAWSDANDK